MDPESGWIRVIFYDLADPRIRDKPFMGSPWPITVFSISFLTLIGFLRHWMKHRKPFKLRMFSIVLQSLLLSLNIFGFLKGWPYWTSKYSWRCEPLDTSNSADALQVISGRFDWNFDMNLKSPADGELVLLVFAA
jgi:GNS1/SUR4 family